MAKMTEDEVAQAVGQQINWSAGYDGDEYSANREQALNYYFNRPRGDEIIGRSQVQSPDLSAMVEAVLSQMLNAIQNDAAVEFEADGPEDEQQAQLESDVVNHFVMSANPGYVTFSTAIKDALLSRNGIVKVKVESREDITSNDWENVNPESIDEILNFVEGATGEVMAYDETAKTMTVRYTLIERKLVVESIAPEDFLFTKNWDSPFLQDIPFCAERKIVFRSDLIEAGYSKSKVRQIAPYTYSQDKIDSMARDPGQQTTIHESPNPATDFIETYECYYKLDVDGDGVAETHHILIAGPNPGSTILLDEVVNLVPYAGGSAFLMPHRFLGLSLYDKLKQVQDIKTGVLRQTMDNFNSANYPRSEVLEGRVNMDDVRSPIPGGAIRSKQIGSIREIQVPDITSNAIVALGVFDKQRSELGGASLDMATAEAQMVGSQVGSQGLDRAYSVMEQLSSSMMVNLSETMIATTYKLVHNTLRENFDQEVQIKRSGKWQTATPSQWAQRDRITVKVGMSVGERNRKSQALTQIMQDQSMLLQQGMDGVMVGPVNMHSARIDWAKSSEIANPEQYYIDPQSQEAAQAIQGKQQAAAAQQEVQGAILQQAFALEQLKTAMDKYKQDTDMQFKFFDSKMNAEIEEMKVMGTVTADINRMELEASARSDEAGARGVDTEASGRSIAPVKPESDPPLPNGNGAG